MLAQKQPQGLTWGQAEAPRVPNPSAPRKPVPLSRAEPTVHRTEPTAAEQVMNSSPPEGKDSRGLRAAC